jgi:hypothetical protein
MEALVGTRSTRDDFTIIGLAVPEMAARDIDTTLKVTVWVAVCADSPVEPPLNANAPVKATASR